MRIGINALYLLPGKVGGTETYLRNLVDSITRLDRDNSYFIFVNRESAEVFQALSPRINIVHCPLYANNRFARILWEQILLPFQARSRKIDALLSPGMTTPFFCPIPSILVIYDLQHVNQPQNFPLFHRFFLQTIIYLSAKTAKGIITISKHVKNDIIKHYRIRPEAIKVTYLGVNHDIFSPGTGQDNTGFRAKYKLPEHYLLYAAALLPHKNHERLLQAFREIIKTMPDCMLVLTGAWEKGYDKIAAVVSALGLRHNVIMLGWLPFEDIVAIYRGSELFVYPTLHEGFGLPILEAMASGVPVVCSRIEPLIEVAGDAALLVEPMDPSDIAQGILSVLKNAQLRQELVGKGFERAKEFTWKKTTEETLRFIETILELQSGKAG